MRKMTTKKRYLVISDLQIPFHHEAAVKNLIKLVKKEKFDLILNTGDELDMQSQSKWAKGTPLEWDGTLDADRSLAQDILYELGTTDVTRSNHTDRLYHTLLQHLASLDCQSLNTPSLWTLQDSESASISDHSSFIRDGSWYTVTKDR
jgi:predicted phosphodiesterase